MRTLGQFSIAKGFYQFDGFPEEAKKNELCSRFAVILHTFYPEKENMFFNDMLYFNIFPNLFDFISYDTIEIKTDESTFSNFEELQKELSLKDEEDREPPPFIYAYKNKKLICIGVTEYWVNCGGKQPYSDSYTISIYTKNDLSSQLQRECFKLCKESGIEIKEIIDSPNHYYKEKESLLKKYCPLEKRC